MAYRYKENDTWICTFCDAENDVNVTRCSICQAANENPNRSIDYKVKPIREQEIYVDINRNNRSTSLDKVQWECDKCMALNSYEVDICTDCHCRGLDIWKWKCTICSFVNEKEVINCTACYQLSPFVKVCPECNTGNINIRHEKCCKMCVNKKQSRSTNVTLNRSPMVSVAKTSDTNTWTCHNCSFVNSNDVDVCGACYNMGPSYGKWICEKCTLRNENSLSNCSACGMLKSVAKPKYNIVVALFNTERVTEKVIRPNLGIEQPNYKRAVCRRCMELVTTEGEQLCDNCQLEYYVCKTNDCGMLMELRKECVKCGNRNHPINREIRRGWRCSYRECEVVNEENCDLCVKCCCYRDLNEKREKCERCGWINYQGIICLKCGMASVYR